MAEVRGSAPEEVPAVVDLCNRVFRPKGGDMGAEFPLLYHPDNAARLRTVWEGGRVFSHAGYLERQAWILGARVQTAAVGAVCTHPERRGEGFASQTMADLERQARTDGCSLMLVSGSRSLYLRQGCRRAGHFETAQIPVGSLPVSTATVRKAEEADIPSLIRMQQSSPVRFERSADDWRAHLRSGFIMCAPADTWLVEWPEGPAAYLGVQRGSKERAASVQEYGGSTMAVIHGLAAAAGEAARIDVLRMPGDYTFPLLGATAENRPQRAFGGTVKIIDPPRFFDSIQDVLFERGGEEVADGLLLAADLDRVTFEWEGHEMDVPTAELSRLVFGAGPGDPPFEMSEGPLESLLPRLFPIPLPCYGYNYI